MFLYQMYPDIPVYHERQVESARACGYVRSPYGRLRWTHKINSESFMDRSEDERVAINTPTQSVSSDSTLHAALIARREGILSATELCLFVHDELVLEVKEEGWEEKARGVIDCYVEGVPRSLRKDFGYEMTIPLAMDCKVGTRLSQMQEVEL